MRDQSGKSRIGECGAGPVITPRKLGTESLGKERNILDPVAERRQDDLEDVEPIEEILAERSRGDGSGKVSVRRADHSHVGPARVRVADAFVFAILEKPEQFRLEGGGQVANLVEEKRPSVRNADLSRIIGAPR